MKQREVVWVSLSWHVRNCLRMTVGESAWHPIVNKKFKLKCSHWQSHWKIPAHPAHLRTRKKSCNCFQYFPIPTLFHVSLDEGVDSGFRSYSVSMTQLTSKNGYRFKRHQNADQLEWIHTKTGNDQLSFVLSADQSPIEWGLFSGVKRRDTKGFRDKVEFRIWFKGLNP